MNPKNSVLVVVDVQNDFLPGGSLAVPEADKIIDPINKLAVLFDKIVLTADSHPERHCSFKPTGPWPPHCIMGTTGWENPLRLGLPALPSIYTVKKGQDPKFDSYSGFKDDGGAKTALQDIIDKSLLLGEEEKHLYIVGIAIEYCVKATVMDALELGYRVHVVTDCCAELDHAGGAKALCDMEEAGAEIILTGKEIKT